MQPHLGPSNFICQQYGPYALFAKMFSSTASNLSQIIYSYQPFT
jgi:hypothetical protein